MSGRDRTRSNRHFRHRFWWRAFHRTLAASALLFLVAEVAVVAVSSVKPSRAQAATAPAGQGFTVTAGDLHFIMKQIKIAEHHSATLTASNPCGTLVGPDPVTQIPDRLSAYGLRTVDGSCNNLFPARERFGAADELFPRLTTPNFRDADPVPAAFRPPNTPVGPATSYKQKTGNVFDDQPRLISNLIVDQTSTNPAAIAASGHPVRSQDPLTPSSFPCTTDPVVDPLTNTVSSPGIPDGCTPKHKTLFIPNVTTDVGLSPPYNSLFTFFGQFFDHGVDQTFKSGGTVFVPLRQDDPLRSLGPDGIANNGDEVPDNQAFMVLTRAKNQPGPDGVLGTIDDRQDAKNTDSPWVDQSQTYTSHPSHQVFLREYVVSPAGRDGVSPSADDNGPVATGKLLGDPTRTPGIHGDTGMAPWREVKKQSRALLGINLTDPDLLDMPMLATDPYGEFLPGAHGLPQLVTKGPDGKAGTTDDVLVEGIRPDATHPNGLDVPSDVIRLDTAFVGDIAHNADPSPQPDQAHPGSFLTPKPDVNTVVDDPEKPLVPAVDPADGRPFYDDELLDTHFAAGDGRANENIALTTIHQIFHSEHDRLVDDIKNTLSTDTSAAGVADLDAFWKPTTPAPAGGPNVPVDANGWAGERLFQAARFVTEMEYQHLVFEEFARKVQPAIRPFHVYNPDQDPAIPAEFAHAVYRFGHSMLDDDVARKTVDPNGTVHDNSVPLLTAFLNPPEYFHNGASTYTAEQAAGAVVMGSTDQVGNELDEFVVETLRNNLLGLPLDLPTINMARAREAGVPPLNELRRQIHDKTNDAAMAPYTDWSDFGQHLKHPESLINYVAAYGTHPTIRDSGLDGIKGTTDDVLTIKAKRDAARAIVDPLVTDTQPADAGDFMFGTGAWANKPDGTTITGLDNVDLWVGGLGEVTNLFGGLLGSTFNYVFQNTLENLQDFDRLYYLNRTPGMNLRTQLEGNSFAELIERNTDGTRTLKADVFATADCKFEVANLTFPATPAGAVNDDPNTECNENALLLHRTDGGIQYRTRNSIDPAGINGQGVYNGTAVVDRIFGGNDNDTIWGNEGDDILDGQAGDDDVLGGTGNDTITDLDGADVLKGGDGNDAIDAGPGDDFIASGSGKDFTEGGANDNETFAGPGDDFLNLGQGADAAFGDGGDDWLQGGTGQDLLQGDHGAPFFDDPAELAPGNDIFVGQAGENDYDAEGGDDLMAQNAAIDRNAGTAGFDWAFHQYDTTGADDDMAINNNLGNGLPVVVNRDRWQETEADSGSPFNDIIRGDEDTPTAVGGGGFTGCDALDTAGLNRISGLAPLVPSLVAPVGTGVIPANQVATATGITCPLSGNVWGDGNILLGGGGADTITGRGGNDIIDGDRALHVRLSIRTNPASPASEVGTTDTMEGKPLNPDLTPNATGNFGPGTAGMTLNKAVFAHLVDPGNIVAVREIVTEPTTPGTNDVAVFTGARANYTVTQGTGAAAGTVTVADNAGTDGTDTLRNIETLRFTDGDVSIAPLATLAPVTDGAFGSQQIGTASATKTFTLRNSGLNPLSFAALTRFSLQGTDATSFQLGATTCTTTLAPNASCTVQVSFKPLAPAGAKSANLVATNDSGGTVGSTQSVPLTGTATTAPPQLPVTGTPAITPPLAMVPGATLRAVNGTLADPNGIRSVAWQWQQTAANGTVFTNVPGAVGTAANLQILPVLPIVNNPNRCRSYRVVATVTDNLGNVEAAKTSAPTPRVVGIPACTAAAPAAAAVRVAAAAAAAPATAVLTPLGLATAARPAPAPLAAGAVSVSASAKSPLAVTTTVPAGASTVAISVFRLNSGLKRSSRTRHKASTVHVATVYRKVGKAKRYVFRLTERKLRHLKPGRYLVEVRVGASRQSLGPAKGRIVTIRRGRATSAR
jgi:Ca2+-binding RTX toxin-like protein